MSENTETAILAGGCYWITQELMRNCDGVISIRPGWTGGDGDNPTEEEPGGHAEAIELVFDADRVSFRDVLELFFQIHRPDLGEHILGSLYRSEIFCTTDEQRRVAEETIADIEASGFWPKIATRISEAGPFLEAEAEDQDYFQRYPSSSRLRQLGLEAAIE
jgi:peptide-methionine (S)-S-oxide reductase